MELDPSQEEQDMPIPLNSTYGTNVHGHGHGHMNIHHHHHHPPSHIIPSSNTPQQIPSNGPSLTSTTPLDQNDHHLPNINNNNFKKIVKYRECLKNHAASMGGNATDGCGEFMPSGEEGSLEALTCSACNCHRNFHRKEIEGEPPSSFSPFYPYPHPRIERKLFLGHNNHKGYFGQDTIGYHHTTTGAAALISSRPTHHQMIMLGSESDDQEEVGGAAVARPPGMVKKRFRTKFTQEQKEKMMGFAEKVGWKMQKQEESVVQQFCQEVGVKRRVLKVWMHNNKHSLAKRNAINHQAASSVNPPPPQTHV